MQTIETNFCLLQLAALYIPFQRTAVLIYHWPVTRAFHPIWRRSTAVTHRCWKRFWNPRRAPDPATIWRNFPPSLAEDLKAILRWPRHRSPEEIQRTMLKSTRDPSAKLTQRRLAVTSFRMIRARILNVARRQTHLEWVRVARTTLTIALERARTRRIVKVSRRNPRPTWTSRCPLSYGQPVMIWEVPSTVAAGVAVPRVRLIRPNHRYWNRWWRVADLRATGRSTARFWKISRSHRRLRLNRDRGAWPPTGNPVKDTSESRIFLAIFTRATSLLIIFYRLYLSDFRENLNSFYLFANYILLF